MGQIIQKLTAMEEEKGEADMRGYPTIEALSNIRGTLTEPFTEWIQSLNDDLFRRTLLPHLQALPFPFRKSLCTHLVRKSEAWEFLEKKTATTIGEFIERAFVAQVFADELNIFICSTLQIGAASRAQLERSPEEIADLKSLEVGDYKPSSGDLLAENRWLQVKMFLTELRLMSVGFETYVIHPTIQKGPFAWHKNNLSPLVSLHPGTSTECCFCGKYPLFYPRAPRSWRTLKRFVREVIEYVEKNCGSDAFLALLHFCMGISSQGGTQEEEEKAREEQKLAAKKKRKERKEKEKERAEELQGTEETEDKLNEETETETKETETKEIKERLLFSLVMYFM